MKRASLLLLSLWCAGNLWAQPVNFSLSANAINFGTVFAGTTVSQTLTLTNNTDSNTPVSFSAISTSGVFGASINPSSVPSFPLGQQATVTVTFTPNAAGAFNGAINITGSGPGLKSSSQAIAVSGTGATAFTTSPSSLNFGNVLNGCTSSQTFTVTASAALSFTVDSTNAAFSAAPTSFTNSQIVTVTFSPKGGGAVFGFININAFQSGTPVGSGFVMVNGTGVDVVLKPNTLSFGFVSMGGSTAQTVQLANNPAVLTAYQYAVSTSNPAFTSSAVSASGSAQITFSPLVPGPASGIITYTITDPNSAVSCPLVRTLAVSGSGVMIGLSPTSIDFGTVPVGTTSAAKTATLTNSAGLDFTGTAASSNPAFALSPTPFRLANSGSQAFSITFQPPAPGPQTGTITFTLTGAAAGTTAAPPSITLTLALSGQGQTPADLTVAPGEINFGDVAVGSTATQTVSVSNPGGASADVTAATAAPFTVSTGSFTLAAGASQTVSLGFAPAGAGTFQGTATFSIAGVTRTVALTGRGVTPTLSYTAGPNGTPVSPGGSAPPVPPTSIGSSNSVPFQIANTGTVPATLNSVSTSDPAFALGGLPALPATVGPGGNLGFTITFSPKAPGPAAATLSINGQTFNISGIGLLASAAISGVAGTVQPADQPQLSVTTPQNFDVPITGQLILNFDPNALYGNDPMIQLLAPSGSGCPGFTPANRCVPFTIPAGKLTAVFPGGASLISFQSGTVAGTISFRATFQAGGVDVTPVPAPSASTNVARGAPVIQSVTASKTNTGLQAVIIALATTREVNNVTVQFTAASGANLGTTSLTLDVGSQFANWYSTAGAAFGSLFKLTIPFALQGDLNAVSKIAVTLLNGDGKSAVVEATVSP